MNHDNHSKMTSLFADVEFINTDVHGAPFRIGQQVEIVHIDDIGVLDLMQADDEGDVIGQQGVVTYFDYGSECGQSFPDMPLVGITFANGKSMTFWPEELAACTNLIKVAA